MIRMRFKLCDGFVTRVYAPFYISLEVNAMERAYVKGGRRRNIFILIYNFWISSSILQLEMTISMSCDF
jgi:hypothetical protein